jgi:hypothetical protein
MQSADALQRFHAALRVDVEEAQGLDLLVEELDARRQVGGEGEHVEDVAAQADLARALDQRLAREAGRRSNARATPRRRAATRA